ncbi:MAG: hemolysin [Anaerolinea sp.]|nr:hemolysin [Anaerolinea sp.]
MSMQTIIILLAVLVFLDLFLTLIRFSLVNAHLPRLLNLREGREELVDRTIRIIERPRIRVSLRTSQAILHLLFGALALLLILQTMVEPERDWTSAVVLLAAGILLVMGEALLERLALANPEAWSMRLGGFGLLVDILCIPLTALVVRLSGQANITMQQFTPPTDDELKSWVETGQTDGALEKEERQMIYSIFQFGDTLAREIMIPRIDMLALDVDAPLTEVVDAVSKSGHSRIPIYEETIDNIIGLLYAKDLLQYLINIKPFSSLRDVMRPAFFVPEAKKLDDLLTEMQSSRKHIAIVVDEYGGVAGLVTLEDILEEIIGEIRDEYDQLEELAYHKLSDDEYIFLGNIDLDDFNEIMGTEIEKEMADTLGGLMYGLIGRVPEGGEQELVENLQLTVENVIGRRIHKVRAKRIAAPGHEAEHET